MRVGLLADIHEAVEPLRVAIAELTSRNVESFVMLGDVLDSGERMDETVALLSALPGARVWGNHDFGLCGVLHPSVRDRYSTAVLEYFATLQPSVTLDGVRFQHIDPHLDPRQIEHLWQFSSATERIEGFARCSEARVFVGHLHAWEIYTPEARIPWNGEGTFSYHPEQRYLTVVHAVVDGWCAVYDSEADVIEPIRVT